jgi:glycosyltransferase involved in cell wall biosynthesis
VQRTLAIYLHDMAGGGVERMRLALLPLFQAAGYETELLLHRRQGELLQRVPANVRIVELGGRSRVSSTALDTIPLVHYLRSKKPNVLLSSFSHNNLVAMAARAIAGTPTRVIACEHNSLADEISERGGWRNKIVPFLYRRMWKLADGFVGVSEGVAENLATHTGIPRDRIAVIYNPVIDDEFAARSSEPISHPWLEDGQTPVFVAVGRLTQQKDYPTLLRAFSLYRKSAKGRLLILGDGPLRAELQAACQNILGGNDIAFLGFVPNPLPLIAKANALVLTSRFEGFGNVLVEALGCGTPAIATNCPSGPAEILANGRFGALLPVGDAQAIAAAMGADLRARWPPAILRKRAQNFSASSAAAKYVSIFEHRANFAPDLLRG